MKISKLGLIITAILGLMVLAWFNRPRTLQQRLERAGVHFSPLDKADPEYNPTSGRVALNIGKGELAILMDALKAEGFHDYGPSKFADGSTSYEMSKGNAQLFFSTGKHLSIIDGKKTSVYFDFPIK